jgi:phosphoglycerate dehydrogenase-like enzyme
MNRDVLILPPTPRAPAAAGELASPVLPATAESAARALEVYGGQAVLLGQPDLAAAVLERLPHVRWVQSTWAGVRPLLQLGRRDYLLSGVRGVFGPQMAEYVFGHVLAHELRLAERRERQRRREWWAAVRRFAGRPWRSALPDRPVRRRSGRSACASSAQPQWRADRGFRACLCVRRVA